MFEMASSLRSFGLSAVAITRLDIASGVSLSEIILLPTSSKYREGSNSLFVGLT